MFRRGGGFPGVKLQLLGGAAARAGVGGGAAAHTLPRRANMLNMKGYIFNPVYSEFFYLTGFLLSFVHFLPDICKNVW